MRRGREAIRMTKQVWTLILIVSDIDGIHVADEVGFRGDSCSTQESIAAQFAPSLDFLFFILLDTAFSSIWTMVTINKH